jgi:hypothetical protein
MMYWMISHNFQREIKDWFGFFAEEKGKSIKLYAASKKGDLDRHKQFLFAPIVHYWSTRLAINLEIEKFNFKSVYLWKDVKIL